MLCNMKRRLRSLSMVGLLGMSLGTLDLADRSAPELAARIENLVSRYAEYGYLNGTVLLAGHGTVIYAKGIGYANMQSHTPNTPQTKFGIASVTKQFTAVLVLQQVAEGRIRRYGKISDYLAWYRKDTGSRMTIEQVLHHTAGLPPDFELPEFSDSEAAK
jgi:CubicO group peptidase (beta-lactamase class C family)